MLSAPLSDPPFYSEDGHMEAVVFKGKCTVALERVPVPALAEPSDALIKIDLCGLCGSDLHPYHCREEGLDVGTVMGHEFVGRVVQTGASVSNFQVGDRVMSPFTTCCGGCFFCRAQLPCRCERGQLFGWVEGGKGLHGAQAQFVRVPLADTTLVRVPDDVSDEEALLLGDIFSTGFFCAHNAGIGDGRIPTSAAPRYAVATTTSSGSSRQAGKEQEQDCGPAVAVVGCGPVGLLAILAARVLGARSVFAIDSVPYRLELAQKFGAQPVDRGQRDALHAVRAATGGRGADVVLEVVGSPSALRAAYDLVRPGGVISAVGCHTDLSFPFNPTEAYNKNITYKCGRCPARFYMEQLLPLVRSKQVDIAAVVSHRLPLRDAVRAYHMFDAREEGCIKVVFRPWE